jgi:RNA polymerase sigma-70 factor (ECF subfamily)
MVTRVAETDSDLVSGALAGSMRAFQQLVRRYERPVFSVILRVVRDPSRAEELAQDTFVKAFLRLETYAPERKFSNWLLAIAHHAAIDEVRRGSVRTIPFEEASQGCLVQDCDYETPYRVTERRELATVLVEAVRQLRPDYAELIMLKYEQDLTLEDITEVTGLPIGTIKSSLHRARKDLLDYLRARGWSGTQ